MRRVRYGVGMSLDALIADPEGGTGFLTLDPTYDSGDFFARVDAAVMGRRTFEAAVRQGMRGGMPGLRTYVCSRTLRAADFPEVTRVEDAVSAVRELRAGEGGDIWLAGGGELFRSLAAAGLVDTVEVGISPVLLGGGVPLLPSPARPLRLELTFSRALPSGVVILSYDVRHES